METKEVLDVARTCVVAVARLVAGVAMVTVAVVLGVLVACGANWLVDSADGVKWVTTAAIAMAGGLDRGSGPGAPDFGGRAG